MSPVIDVVTADIMKLPVDFACGCDLTYTDPPWEQRMVKSFETMAHKQSGLSKPGNQIEAILRRLFLLSPTGAPVFVEYGRQGWERVCSAARGTGRTFAFKTELPQTNGKPYLIWAFDTNMPPVPDYSGDAWAVLDAAAVFHRPRLVFEPFVGLGKTARRWKAHGASVRGAELNPERAARARGRG